MRPLVPPPLFAEHTMRDADEHVPTLLDTYGPYCSICERPLFERAFAWNPQNAAPEASRQAAFGPWLLLCMSCDGAQAAVLQTRSRAIQRAHALARGRRPSGEEELVHQVVETLLREPATPFGRALFSVSSIGPLTYTFDGDVTVRGDSPADVLETVGLFGLAGEGREATRRRLRIRTVEMARASVSELGRGAAPLPRWLPRLMATTGFLSAWLTVLLDYLEQPTRVVELLDAGRQADPSFYPGTDWELLEAT